MGTDATPFSVTFLGTRDAAKSPSAFTSSQLVTHGEIDVLVDAGLGSAAQLARAGREVASLEAVVLTHWHPDHVAGLPALIRRAGARLRVLGPAPPTSWWPTLRGASLRPLKARLELVEPGDRHVLGGLELEAFATEHGVRSVGWRLREWNHPGRTVVVPGDTRPTEEVTLAATGADLLVFEATFLDRHTDAAVKTHHATAFEAGTLAAAAGCGTLALTHLSERYPRTEVRAEAELAFPRVLVPSDLDRLELAADGAVSLVAR